LPEIHVNARHEAAVKNPETKNPLEVDVWVPSLQLCFEFQVFCLFFLGFSSINTKGSQDIYHYRPAFYSHVALHAIQSRDSISLTSNLLLFDLLIYLKIERIRQRPETLIAVPYWWSGDKERYNKDKFLYVIIILFKIKDIIVK
jgi:hypothetical protein